ncbi:MAG: drug:proton antiporter [Pseudopedobacter saltans]|uniref:Drug:proton antiporter n=1 Tax=Pseudopedobacter saltans TaxID=151895 RepID=A0A2W5EFK0_9SPHI|nr:MAG: drug:proton antiporter [Pseudopedobacter saltans]
MDKRALTISLIVGGAFLMENLDSTVISTALPAMAISFKTDPVHLSAGITSYLIMLAVFIPISGWVADKFGTRNVFGGAMIGFLVSSMLCGLSQTLTQFVCARVLQGTAGAMMVPVGRLSVLKNTEKKDLVTAIAYITWPGLIGPIVGPILGGVFTTYLSWHWIFFINVPLGIIALILIWKYIPNSHSETSRPLDFVGFVLSALALSSFMYGLETFSRGDATWAKTVSLLIGSVVLIVINVFQSRKKEFPLIDFSVLKIKTYAVTIYSGSLTRMVIGMAPFLVPMLFQVGFGLNAFQSGMIYMASMVGNLVVKPATITVTRKFDFRKALVGNGLLLAVSTFATGLLIPTTPLWITIVVMFASGAFRSMQFSSLNTLAYSDIPMEKMSNANTLYSTAQQMSLGMGIALGAVTLHLSSVINHTNNQYQLKDFHLAFFIIGVLSLLSLIEYFRLSPKDGLSVRGITAKDNLAT